MNRPKPFPAGVSAYRDRHGKLRTRFRRKGQLPYSFKAEPFSADWWAEYQACIDGTAALRIQPGAARIVPGTIADLISRYYRSADWQGPNDRTRHSFRLVIDRFNSQLGDVPVAEFTYEHASALMGTMAARPNAANKLRKLLARVWDEGLRIGLVERINPWRLVKAYRVKGTYHTWTEEEIGRFITRWPVGTREYLALALMLNTAQRRGDAIRLGPQHVRDGRLVFAQRKTGKALSLPIVSELREAIAACPSGHLTFLVTEHGSAFTDAGFGNWFADKCRAAGVPGRAHGLRKAAAKRLAEEGATNQELKSWTGHVRDEEVALYVAAASQRRLADSGAAKLAKRGTAVGEPKAQILANPSQPSGNKA
jgi:integrase